MEGFDRNFLEMIEQEKKVKMAIKRMQKELGAGENDLNEVFSEVAQGGRYLLEHHLAELMAKPHRGILRRMDSDNDGLVGLADFQEFCRRHASPASTSISTSCMTARSVERKHCSPLKLYTPVRETSPPKTKVLSRYINVP
jgi:hypothetical protein